MEEDGSIPLRHIPPHGQPSPPQPLESCNTDDLPQNTSPQESEPCAEGHALESVAIELYAETLLSRAHLLLVNSTNDDVDTQEDPFDRSREALVEAESLCFAGQHPVSDALVAKCWYIRGCLADVCGDDENASRCFIETTNLDESYKSLERVKWYLQRQHDLEDVFGRWSGSKDLVLSPIGGYHLGGLDSENESSLITPSPSPSMSDFRQSELYQFLMYDIKHKTVKESRPSADDLSPVSPLHQPHHLPPIATPQKAPSTDKVDQLVQKKIHSPGGRKRASPKTREALKGSENSPVRDLFLLQVEECQKKAMVAEEERRRQIREDRTRQSVAHSRRLSGGEALLSDGLSIAGLDTTTAPAENGAALTGKLTINTRGIRRQSISSKSSDRSPALPSPLRKASLPGDAQVAAEGRESEVAK
ncbi:hypothetical protein AYO20_10911 [Fonsecaea nubica]|uniref:Uncharacterized protein n=1 Tax=Fonsecaea nubica TaxID=856822 RepID=A0A178C3A1_9EURO|nr:hypothetical protein AYO20_10911 [Fonsecaea nubica]OAL23706.1 hypothetical protein AYO20_10911 [Fonsecaea nubica]